MPSDRNRETMVKARSEYKKASWKCRRDYEKKQTSKLLEARFKNVKLYWKMLSGKNIRKKPNVTLDEFYYHFMGLSNPEDTFYRPDDDIVDEYRNMMQNDIQVMFEELNVSIEESEIAKAIKELKCSKSGGPDLIINELFLHGSDILIPNLKTLFNHVFRSGIFPQEWSEGILIPLYKKGNSATPSNYRGITLLSVLGKLFTRILNSRLDTWAENYGIYVEAQYGFRKGRSTTDCMFILHNMINKFIQSDKKRYTFLIDYSKAFDYVVHENLWYKLYKCGVNGKILEIIMSMYSAVRSRVFLDGNSSHSFECKLGVRQGECLSPFLFAIYINDLEENISETNAGITIGDIKMFLLFYADDVVLFSETPEGLQSEIDKLHNYCQKWKLKLNTDKSQIVVFRKGNRPVNIIWRFGENELKVTNKINYLGLIFTSNGSFHQSNVALANKATKAIFALNSRLSLFCDLKPEHRLDLFDKFIAPILNYGCEVWGFENAKQIETVHLGYCKRILGVKRSTQNDFIYGILGRFPFHIYRQIRIIKYWLKIVSGRKSLYVNNIYHSSISSDNFEQKPSWALSVKNLLLRSGFGDVWYAQGVGNENLFLLHFQNRMHDIYKQDWHDRLENSSRARFYRSLDLNFTLSSFLKHIECKQHRQSLTRLIVSSHALHIESGRWKRPKLPSHMRYCFACTGKVEDEYHLLLECSLYSDIRSRFIPKYYWTRPSMYKAINLLNCESKKITQNIAKFVFLAFKRRAESQTN